MKSLIMKRKTNTGKAALSSLDGIFWDRGTAKKLKQEFSKQFKKYSYLWGRTLAFEI